MQDLYTDGWRRYSGNFFYVSASSFKVTGDERSKFPVGTRIRFTQVSSGATVTKYFSVAIAPTYSSSPDETTVTVVTNSTATIANSDIASPCLSYESVPQGYTGFAGDMKVAKVALTAGNANAFAFAWQNPESSKILVTRVLIDRTTAGGTGSSVLNVGPGATATTASDTLIDGLDLNATGIADNISNIGTNGLSTAKLDENGGTTDYITGQILAANAASLVGNAYIFYITV
ncbi:MAG: hypothetical protein HY865_22585 [Chloroflexi bacterium]|nr:hypothetical protein [Chloroflexota bacterium]